MEITAKIVTNTGNYLYILAIFMRVSCEKFQKRLSPTGMTRRREAARLTITQLRYFATIAQLENVSQASQLLHLSQSSLSKTLAKLEEEVGMPLFDRSGRKLSLNAAGARLLEYSTLVLRELEFALDDMHLLSTGTGARIKIGAAGISRRLASCVAAFHEHCPEAEFELSSSIEGMEHLNINDFDMLVYPAGGKYEKFTGIPFCEERYCLVANAGHPLAGAAAILPKALNGQSMVFLRDGRSFVEYPFRICSALALRFRSQCYVDNRQVHRQLISSGVCLGFAPESSGAFYREEPALRLVPIQDQRFTRQMMLCFRREKHLSPLARRFRDFVLDYFGLSAAHPV